VTSSSRARTIAWAAGLASGVVTAQTCRRSPSLWSPRRVRRGLRRTDRVLPIPPGGLRRPHHPARNHRRRGRVHRVSNLDRRNVRTPAHAVTRRAARTHRRSCRHGPHEHLPHRRRWTTRRRARPNRLPQLSAPARRRGRL